MQVADQKPSVDVPKKVQQTDIHVHVIPVEQQLSEPQKNQAWMKNALYVINRTKRRSV